MFLVYSDGSHEDGSEPAGLGLSLAIRTQIRFALFLIYDYNLWFRLNQIGDNHPALEYYFTPNNFILVVRNNRRVSGDSSVHTYKGHTVLHTLIRCYFSPSHTTGQRYIYTGCARGSCVSW